MKWTKERPTVPGWYWVRHYRVETDVSRPGCDGDIAWVHQSEFGMAVYMPFPDKAVPVEAVDAEWSGPIALLEEE